MPTYTSQADAAIKTVSDTFSDDEIARANDLLRDSTPTERIAWAVRHFSPHLYALTSAGVYAALTLDHISRVSADIPVIHINTGFLPPETLEFRGRLQERYGFHLHEFGPPTAVIADIVIDRLWETDIAAYSRLTKVVPLTKAIRSLGVRAVITNVRADQNANRAAMLPIGRGNDGEVRIRPFIDWPEQKVDAYFQEKGLPRHPLWPEYGSVEDYTTMAPGTGRSGRGLDECGIHFVDGRVVRGRKMG